jgi:hypothetical protein
LERREHTRYGVRALVDFEWIDEGESHHGRGLTRDINSKGMFIYSDSEPPVKTDLQVEVSFSGIAETPTNLRLSAESLVIRVDSAPSGDERRGFAILNRSYKLRGALAPNDEWNSDFEIG